MNATDLQEIFKGRRFRAEWAPAFEYETRTDCRGKRHKVATFRPRVWLQERTAWNDARGHEASELEKAAAIAAGLPREVPTRFCDVAGENVPDYDPKRAVYFD